MFENLTRRPMFANCKDEDAALSLIGTLENKAEKYDSVIKENDALKQKLKGFEDAAAEARKKEIESVLDSAVKDERIRPADRETYKSLLEKDFENASKILEGLPKKKMIKDVINPVDSENKSDWDKEQDNIKKRRYNR